ncbi:MAG: endolytic transglycosylase MltG [Deltaproteobacteria bacterium]|nr:endolytic transglycosylase MltG [Deltaproteobacteria bacterium]
MMKRLVVGLLLCVGVASLGGWFFHGLLHTPGPPLPQPVRIYIPERSSLHTTAESLVSARLLTNPRLFLLWARLTQQDRKIQEGEYLFTSALSPVAILHLLTTGASLRYSITVIEGMTFRQVVALLVEKELGAAEQFLCLNRDPQFLAAWGLPPQGLEGYLYPATYRFSRRATPEEILGQMIARFYAALSPALYRQIAASKFSVHRIVTLASLIEKETGAVAERALVSAVFHNRLRQQMPLQCDSTVIYGVPEFDGNLTRQHLTTPSPYNTYLLRGLPPGPIASPSLESIVAALNPAPSDYLYFVAKGDGTHEFSVDLSAHNRAVRRFQKGQS